MTTYKLAQDIREGDNLVKYGVVTQVKVQESTVKIKLKEKKQQGWLTLLLSTEIEVKTKEKKHQA